MLHRVIHSILLLITIFSSITTVTDAKNSTTTSSSKHIETNSLLTCMDNSQFTASYFDVRFYPGNNTVVFKIDATTTINQKVIVQAEVLTYGLKIINKEFDPCSLDQDALCPLSPGRIDVSSSYQLDSDVTNQIPGIAYTVPDLDAQVRVIVYSINDTDFKTPLACVQAILSNGKTVQTKYASWPIAAISGAGVLTSGFVSVIGYSATATHIASNSISLFIYFQNLAITAMMGVSRVPPIAAAWTQNFQWSMGIINEKFMQNIFNWYVQATKGTSTVVVANKDVLSISVQKKKRDLQNWMMKNDAYNWLKKRAVSVASASDYNFDDILDDSTLYTTNERNSTEYASKILVLRGIPRVSYLAGIEISNFFLTGVVFFLFFLFVVVFALIFFKSLLELLVKTNVMSESSNFFQYRKNWGSIIKGTLYRLAIIAFPQITLLCIYEFTQNDSPAVMADAVIILIIIICLLSYGCTRVMLKGGESLRLYKNPAYLLYGDTQFLNRYGFLYAQFKADRYWWVLPLLLYSFFRSLFVAVLQEQGKAQAMIIFIIELIYFGCLCWIRPYLDKRTNIFNIAIHLVNLVNAFFFLFFSNLFKQPAVVSSIMAVILFVLNAVFALFLLIFTIITCSLALIYRNPDVRYQPMKDDRVSFIPKVQIGGESTMDLNDKNDAELFELRQAVMDTNETDQEKLLREKRFSGKPQILFDSNNDYDGGSSLSLNNTVTRNRSNSSNIDLQPTQAMSPLFNNNNSAAKPIIDSNNGYLRAPADNRNTNNKNLKKPETSFYGSGPTHSYSRDFL
ncbi:similar to Saccharomyces cerevisiae YAL053W FLC2 Putative FAD transporter [Maudiozyma saulgeensis]|uniref:Similar to Saccharomyces cerevisiae YAL053W FLC2 Putative FAD transporter n=1 Tax=Maudiozyma saulgeensis TaxID=1789683 RepID=A0A1X7QZG9_9SACH|nr:similar to Saccharomyces cerevisiae YAL053W FLC2 Putative FAD transporter [Kazachstania saulgeensis]